MVCWLSRVLQGVCQVSIWDLRVFVGGLKYFGGCRCRFPNFVAFSAFRV